MRRLISTVLGEVGYSVITTEDGEDAVRKFKENKDRVSLVILDMIMLQKGGKEVFEEIRGIRPEIPVLFASGCTADGIQSGAMTGERHDFIMKPMAPGDLLKKIRDLLDK